MLRMICAKFDADLINISKVTSRKTKWPRFFAYPVYNYPPPRQIPHYTGYHRPLKYVFQRKTVICFVTFYRAHADSAT